MPKCKKCGEEKPEAAFRVRCNGQLRGECKVCYNASERARAAPGADPVIDQGMVAFGTPLEREAAEVFLTQGSVDAAATALGLTPNQLRRRLSELAARAARRGWSPSHDMKTAVPDGYHVKGVSTYYDADGLVRGQWVKSNRDQEHQIGLLLDAVQAATEPLRGLVDPVLAPIDLDEDLLAVYVMGDPHFGMHAWAEEAGENFDLKVAEADLIAAVDDLVASAPPAKHAVICTVGDTVHADSSRAETAKGTRVDVDTRWRKVLEITIRAMRRAIERARQKHETVTMKVVPGNHDPHTAMVIALCLAAFYERDPRVIVDTGPSKFSWHRHGRVLLGFVHGDTTKDVQLPGIMAVDRKADWGETDFRHFYSGHVHHDTVKEFPGCTVEHVRTLAASDAWHHGSGYRSGRDMKCDIWHREWGRRARYIVGIRQVQAAGRFSE